MRAAGLHAIGTLLETEAVLIKSTLPKHAHLTPLMERITKRIAGVVARSKCVVYMPADTDSIQYRNRYVLCQYNIPRQFLAKAIEITPGRRAPTVSPLDNDQWVGVSSMVEKKKVADVMDQLVEVGAEDVLLIRLDNCRV